MPYSLVPLMTCCFKSSFFRCVMWLPLAITLKFKYLDYRTLYWGMQARERTMKELLLLYQGPATPPDASHEEWPQWFNKLGDKLVDRGLPMAYGRSLLGNGSPGESPNSPNGFLDHSTNRYVLVDIP